MSSRGIAVAAIAILGVAVALWAARSRPIDRRPAQADSNSTLDRGSVVDPSLTGEHARSTIDAFGGAADRQEASAVDGSAEAPAALSPNVEAERVSGLMHRLWSRTADVGEVLDLTLTVLAAASEVEPRFDAAEGGLVYDVISGEDMKIELVALPAPMADRDQYQLRITTTDAPGFRGPVQSVQGGDLRIHFVVDEGAMTSVSALARANVHNDEFMRQHSDALGPIEVGSLLTVGRSEGAWMPMTRVHTVQDGMEGWLTSNGERMAFGASLADPRVDIVRSHLELLAAGGR